MPSALPRLAWVMVVFALAGACQPTERMSQKEPVSAQGPGSAASEPESMPAEAAERAQVNFKINGKKKPEPRLGDETVLLSLEFLPAIEEWKMLIVRNTEGREFRATKPTTLTGERTMKIVRQSDGSFEFQVVQLVAGAETLRHRMPKVKVVEIHTQDYTPPPQGAESRVIAIQVEGATRQVNSSALQAIARRAEPGSEKERNTWLLLDVLGQASLSGGESIYLRSHGGKELTLSSSEIADQNFEHMIKQNRRGQFHYRAWRIGDPPSRSAELRNLSEIEVR